MKATYSSVREQLVTLQIDLEDKEKICKAIENKIEEERRQLSKVERDFEHEYNQIIDEETVKHRTEIENIVKNSNEIMVSKKNILLECKSLVEDIQTSEKELAIELKKQFQELEDIIDQDKRKFKLGYEERLQTFINNKLKEYTDSTERALQPEILRLQSFHERELSDIEQRFKTDERKLKEELNNRFEQSVKDDQISQFEKLKSLSRSFAESTAQDLDALERQHREVVLSLQSDLERELTRVRSSLSQRAAQERGQAQAELKAVEELTKQRTRESVASHQKELESLKQSHENKMRLLEEEAETKRREREAAVRGERRGEGKRTNNESKGEEERTREASFVVDSDRRREKEREGQVQAIIRQMQAETIRLEKEWRSSVSSQSSTLKDLHRREEEALRRRQRQVSDEVADLLTEREEAGRALGQVETSLSQTRRELQGVEEQRDRLERAVEEARDRVLRMEEGLSSRAGTEDREAAQTLLDLEEEEERLRADIERQRREGEGRRREMRSKHDSQLSSLEARVKGELEALARRAEGLRDALHTERLRAGKIDRLRKQYME